jgi:hypothetical protein
MVFTLVSNSTYFSQFWLDFQQSSYTEFGYFGVLLFVEIFVNFVFLAVHNVFLLTLQKDCFCSAESKSVWILIYLYPFPSYTWIYLRYFNNAHDRTRFFWASTAFFNIISSKIWIVFPLRAEIYTSNAMILSHCYHIVKKNIPRKLSFHLHFLSKDGFKMPFEHFPWCWKWIFQIYSENGVKKHKQSLYI